MKDLHILYPFLSHTLSRFKKSEIRFIELQSKDFHPPTTGRQSPTTKYVVPFTISEPNDILHIEELLHTLFSLGFDMYLLHEEKHKIYRLFDNPYTFTELMDGAAKGSLLGIHKEHSLFTLYFSHMSKMSGAEISMFNQIDEMRSVGALSHVVTPHRGLLTEKLRRRGIPYDVVAYYWWGNVNEPTVEQTALSLQTVSGYQDELKKINPHIVYTNSICIPWGAYAALLLKKPHIWHIKEFGVKDHNFQFIFDFSEIKRIIAQTSSLILFNSHAVEKDFLQGIACKTPTKTLYYNVHIEPRKLKVKVPSLYKNTSSLKLILVGNVYPTKGQLEALQAVTELNKRSIPVELVILGQLNEESTYYKELMRYVQQNNLHNVYFHAYVPNPYPYMNQADVVLMCSKLEAFGKVTVEAMLLKKVVIGANTGGTKEIIQEGKNGFLYKQGNSLDLAQKILRLNKDRLLLTTVGKTAQQSAIKSFATNSYIGQLENLMVGVKKRGVLQESPFAKYVAQILTTTVQSPQSSSRLKNVLNRLRVY